MKIPFVYRCAEGELLHQGINWRKDWASRFALIIYLWRFQFYFRLRSKNVGGKRVVWSIDYFRKYVIGRGIEFEFDTRSLRINGHRISVEFLEDVRWEELEKYRWTTLT